MTRIRTLNGALYTLGILGALTFGAVQAFASSDSPQAERSYCPEAVCDKACGPGAWYCEGWGGTCVCI